MNTERAKAINDWLGIHCPKCEYNADKGTGHIDCQAECEVLKNIGIACIHYKECLKGGAE